MFTQLSDRDITRFLQRLHIYQQPAWVDRGGLGVVVGIGCIKLGGVHTQIAGNARDAMMPGSEQLECQYSTPSPTCIWSRMKLRAW